MKLQKITSRKYKDKYYNKYIVVLPIKVVEGLKWKEGTDLDCNITDKEGEIILSIRKTDIKHK